MSRRLIVGFGGSFVALAVFSGCVLYALIARELQSRRSVLLQDRIDAIASLLKSPAHGREELGRRVLDEWPARGGERTFFLVTDGSGSVVVQTAAAPPAARAALASLAPGADPSLQLRSDDEGRRFLARSVELENSIGLTNPVRVRAVIGEDQSLDFLRGLRRTLASTLLVNVGISLFVGWRVVRKQTLPLNRMATQIARIGPANLGERLPIDGLPSELSGVAAAFNRAMDGLAHSIDRLSRFSSDISHELRTPIGNAMASIEVTLSRARSDEEYREALETSYEECERVSRIVDGLLLLARHENGGEPLRAQTISVERELDALAEFYLPSAEDAGVTLEQVASDAPNIVAEPTLFQRAIGNLISNAIRYSAAGGRVRVSARAEGARTVIEVVDDGAGIPAKDLPRVFERFYRVDASRANASGGMGLGLAIVKSIVEVHGGEVTAESALGKGTRMTVFWPSARETIEQNGNPAV